MFSPKVLNADPCVDRTLMTLFVRFVVGGWSGPGSWVETIYCSFRMSYRGWLRDIYYVTRKKKRD